MSKSKCIRVESGKDLLDLGVTRFEVVNRAWVGEIVIKNGEPYLERHDYHGELVSTMRLYNNSYLGLIIEPWEYREGKVKQSVIKTKPIDIFYLCDNMACSKSCNGSCCRHTSDIEHAIHKDDMEGRLFEYTAVGTDGRIGFFEKEVEDDTDT